MNSELVSIVVPIYKVEEYLSKCLDSLIEQTYSNIEIILIDDGSPDNCGVICDEYGKKDARIKVLHVNNGGVAKARQQGVESATGEFIIFVDPDDWLPLDAVMNLYSNMEDDIDVVLGAYNVITKDTVYEITEQKSGYIEDLLPLIMMQQVASGGCMKIYRRGIFDNDSFPSLPKGQDYMMNIKLSTNVKRAKFIENIVYCYFERGDSTTQTKKYSQNIILQFISVGREILEKAGIYEERKELFLQFALMNLRKIIRDRELINPNDPQFKQVIKDLNGYLTRKDRLKIFVLSTPLGRNIYLSKRKALKFINQKK